jgi:alpha-galactosidase
MEKWITKTLSKNFFPSKISCITATYRISAENTQSLPGHDTARLVIDTLSVDELLATLNTSPQTASPLLRTHGSMWYIQGTGWQSWSPGWELGPAETYPHFISFPVPVLKKYIYSPANRPADLRKQNTVTGQFICYIRTENHFFVMASTGTAAPDLKDETGLYSSLPPVQYHINRDTRKISCSVYCAGKQWNKGDLIARIVFFEVADFFIMKDCISWLYRNVPSPNGNADRFKSLQFLSTEQAQPFQTQTHQGKKNRNVPGGWESWYNHYNKINSALITEDLETLDTSNNLIKLMYIDRKKPVIFQIDDGWQQGLGQWEVNIDRFPGGLAPLARQIVKKGYIPGLWIAPFLIDLRTEFCAAHYAWVLKDRNGKPIPAGFNTPWGALLPSFSTPKQYNIQPGPPYSYYCLDLSRDDVIDYLDTLIGKIIDEWGFRYLKMDFLFAGMLPGNHAVNGAVYEWYARAINILTRRTHTNQGESVAYLGCGMPFEASYRNFPLSRIGADTLEKWDRTDLRLLRFGGRPSAYISMKDTLGHAFWDQSVFQNDPDVVFFRNENIQLTPEEKETLALVNYLFASQIMHSDDPASFNSPADEPLTRHVLDLYDRLQHEEFGNYLVGPDIYLVFSRSRTYFGILNLSDLKCSFSSADLRSFAGVAEDAEFNPVPLLAHHTQKRDIYTFRIHTLTLFEL